MTFASETKTFDSLPNPIPLPKDLADVQVLLNDRALPLYFVSPGQINYLVPMDIAQSGSPRFKLYANRSARSLPPGPLLWHLSRRRCSCSKALSKDKSLPLTRMERLMLRI